MAVKIEPAFGGDGYWTDAYSVRRWSKVLNTKPGTYIVIATPLALALAWMGDGMTYSHPVCVVDDFGQLVKVPA